MTYRHLLDEPSAFGKDETLEGAIGTLSLTDSEKEKGYSINTLFVKYRTQLVGHYWAEVFGKEFPLQFSFCKIDDVTSIRAELVDENGYHYASDVQTILVEGDKTLDLKEADSFVALVPKTGECTVSDAGSELTLHAGQLALVPAEDKTVAIHGQCQLKSIRCVNEK